VGALTRRIALLEVDYEQTSARLSTASDKLDEASKHAEEAERWSQHLSTQAYVKHIGHILVCLCRRFRLGLL